jgi:hypothetical protein
MTIVQRHLKHAASAAASIRSQLENGLRPAKAAGRIAAMRIVPIVSVRRTLGATSAAVNVAVATAVAKAARCSAPTIARLTPARRESAHSAIARAKGVAHARMTRALLVPIVRIAIIPPATATGVRTVRRAVRVPPRLIAMASIVRVNPARVSVRLMVMPAPVRLSAASVRTDRPRVWKA